MNPDAPHLNPFARYTERFFFLYGKTDDEFCVLPQGLLRLEEALYRHLRHLNYIRILCFNGRQKLYCYDSDSKRLCRERRRVSPSSPAATKSRMVRGPLGMRRVNQSPPPPSPPTPTSDPTNEPLHFGGMNDMEAVNTLDQCMRNGLIQTAVIFTDGLDFIGHTEADAVRHMALVLKQWTSHLLADNRNICIFIFPDMEPDALRRAFDRYPQWSFLQSRMFLSGASSDQLIYVGPPKMDEIESMLHYLRLRQNLPTAWHEFPDMRRTVLEYVHSRRSRLNDVHRILNAIGALTVETIQRAIEAYGIPASGKPRALSEEDAAVSFGITVQRLLPVPPAKPKPLTADILKQAFSGVLRQEDNTDQIIRAVHQWSRLVEKQQPLSLFFVGTSGVGKTYTVECLAESLAQFGYGFSRYRMNEYQQEHTVSKLIGSPPGYVGSETEPRLFTDLRQNHGKLVVLFDEIEKAHENILTALMQLIAEGSLSWNAVEGDFRECILCFTSNAERERMVRFKSQWIAQGKTPEDLDFHNGIRDILVERGIAPEICGRIGHYLVYNPLDEDAVARIAIREIGVLAKRYGLEVRRIAPEFLAELIEKCTGSLYGARPLKKAIETYLGVGLADAAGSESTVSLVTGANGVAVVPANASDPIPLPDDLILAALDVLRQRKKAIRLPDQDTLTRHLSHVLCQKDSIAQIVSSLRQWYAQVQRKRPLSFFMVGTSGVGKTYTAECLASALSDIGYGFTRFRMTEYQEEHTVSKLIGSPTGYVGSEDEPKIFTDLKKSNGKLVILFDEIEKAHPRLLMALMQLIDEGALSWSKGEGNFKDCIVCFTSNAERERMIQTKQQWMQHGGNVADTAFHSQIRDILVRIGIAPEICGRIGRFLVYDPLTEDALMQIAAQEIHKIGEAYGLQIRHIHTNYLTRIAQKYAGSIYGARPLRQELEQEIGNRIVDFRIAYPDAGEFSIDD